MPDQPRALRIRLALTWAVVLLLATVAYAVLAALGDAPWNVVPGPPGRDRRLRRVRLAAAGPHRPRVLTPVA